MKKSALLIAVIASLSVARVSSAVRIADIVRIDGRQRILEGTGLVIGLKGAGDGSDYLPAMTRLALVSGFGHDTQEAR